MTMTTTVESLLGAPVWNLFLYPDQGRWLAGNVSPKILAGQLSLWRH